MTFHEKLDRIINQNNSLVCVGLDSDTTKFPDHLAKKKNAQFQFNKAIIDATHDVVCAYKPNSAFYEALGADGIKQLQMTCEYIQKNYSEIPIILDAKRGDIGSTNNGYVQYAFDYLQVDAITLHPYLGKESLEPFLEKKDKGLFFLCRTSNRGAGEFQDLLVDGMQIYKRVAKQISKDWNINNNCMLVVGATYPKELKDVRKIVGNMTLLIPGIGAQGGNVKKIIQSGLNAYKKGLIISSSRGIIFASSKKDFAEKAREETLKLRNEINSYR